MNSLMCNNGKLKLAALALFVMVNFIGGQAAADLVVVGHSGLSIDTLDSKAVKNIFLGKTRSLSNGTVVKVFDQADENEIKSVFHRQVTEKSMSQLKAYWSKMIFSGKAIPPESLKSDAEVIQTVSSTPGAIGYVNANSVTSSVKVLYKITE